MQENSSHRIDTNIFAAALAICRCDYDEAHHAIEKSRDLLDKKVTALAGESYNRAYKTVLTVQQLAELEEIIEYKQTRSMRRRTVFRGMWNDRLLGARRDVLVWQRLLQIRRIVLPCTQDPNTYVKFVSLCSKSGDKKLAAKTLADMMSCDPEDIFRNPTQLLASQVEPPVVKFAYLQFLWNSGKKGTRSQALHGLTELAARITSPEYEA